MHDKNFLQYLKLAMGSMVVFDKSYNSYLLLQVVQTISESKKAFFTIAALVRMHLISHLDLMWVVTEGRRIYEKRSSSKNKSPTAIQMTLF